MIEPESPPGREREEQFDRNVMCAPHGVQHEHMRTCGLPSAWVCAQHGTVRYTAAAIVAHIRNDAAGLPL